MATPARERWRRAAAPRARALALLRPSPAPPPADAGDRRPTRTVYATGKIVPIPASIPHEEGDMVDRRILPDLRWIAEHFPIYVTDGYSGPLPNGEHVGCNRCHTRALRPLQRPRRRHRPRGRRLEMRPQLAPITRLAHWAEPVQNQPASALPLGRLRRRRRPRLRQPPPPLLEPRPGARVPARRMGRSLADRPPRRDHAAGHDPSRLRRRRRAKGPTGGISQVADRRRLARGETSI